MPPNEYSIGLFPTRINSSTTLDFFANKPEDVVVQLETDPGTQVVGGASFTKI